MDEIDQLRTEIESGERFKTVFQGFDKKQVQETVAQLMTENAELSEQLERSRSEITNLKKRLRDLQRENAELEAREIPQPEPVDTAAMEAEIEARYIPRIQDLENQLQDAQGDLDSAAEQVVAARTELKACRAELSTARAQISAARDEADSFRAEAYAARNEANSARAREEEARAAAENARNEADAARAEAFAARAEARSAQQALAEAPPPAPAPVPEPVSAPTPAPVPAPVVEESDTPDLMSGRNLNELGARFVVEDLKGQIAKLSEEKRARGLRIAELEEMLQQEKESSAGKMAMLTSLNDNMANMLQEKLDELNEVAAGWKDAFAATAM